MKLNYVLIRRKHFLYLYLYLNKSNSLKYDTEFYFISLFILVNDDTSDLMSCSPKWVPVDSSDEEIENLRNDPALNLKFDFGSTHSLPSPKKSLEFSDAVIEYKKRRSLELNSSFNQTTSNQPVSNQV